MSSEVGAEVDGKYRQYQRVLMSYVDLQQASGIASYLLDSGLLESYPKDRFAAQGLSAALIVAYCRPFSGNDRGTRPKVPDLPQRALKELTPEERELHGTLMGERNKIVSHSDSAAWDAMPAYHDFGSGKKVLVPRFNYVHAPLLPDVIETIRGMATRLMEWCFEERRRLEEELGPFLPTYEYNPEALRGAGKELGIDLPSPDERE